MTLREYVDILKKWWKVLAALTAVGLLTGGILAVAVPSKYEATAQLYVSIPTSDSATELNQAATYLARELKSYTTVATSPYVLEPVRRDTGMNDSVSELQDMLDVTNPTATSVIQVTATADSPGDAQTLANGVVRQLTKGVETLSPEVANRPGTVRAKVLSEAPRPDKTSGIPAWAWPLAGLVVGALVGVVAAMVLESLVRRPRTTSELRTVPGAALTATLPRMKHVSDARSFDPVLGEQVPAVQNTPQITAMRARLQQRHPEVLPHNAGCAVLAVTGSRGGDGATTVAVELARSFAALGSRVALVDAHFSDRGATVRLAQQEQPGISDLLERRASAEQGVVRLGPGLTFLPAGSPTDRASDLVCSETMGDLVRELRSEFDVVVLDCAPLDESADAVVLGELADEILLVTVPGRVTADALQNCVTQLRGAPVSLVANKVRSTRGSSGLV